MSGSLSSRSIAVRKKVFLFLHFSAQILVQPRLERLYGGDGDGDGDGDGGDGGGDGSARSRR